MLLIKQPDGHHILSLLLPSSGDASFFRSYTCPKHPILRSVSQTDSIVAFRTLDQHLKNARKVLYREPQNSKILEFECFEIYNRNYMCDWATLFDQ